MPKRTPNENTRIWLRIERLSAATIRITAEHDLDRVLQEIVDSARDVIGARYAALGVLDSDGTTLDRFVTSGMNQAERDRIGDAPAGKGILRLLIDDPKPLRLADLTKHPTAYGFHEHHPRMQSFLGVPIIGREGAIGNLYMTEKVEGAEFSKDDEMIAVVLAGHAAVAIENARLYQQGEQLLAELKTMQQSRDRFYAMINHELRNALTATYGWADLWLRRHGDNPPRAATEVYESTEKTLVLLEDLLQLSRLDADKLQPHIQDVNGLTVVYDAIRAVEPAADRKNVIIETTGYAGELVCQTDPQRVRQILINLLTNAVRHSPEDELISVDIRVTDDRMRFDVVDRGEGIAGEEQSSIFEAFERGRDQRERGTGLGLALSRQLARLLGGDLRVESRLGHGARFILDLPRYPQAS